MQDNKENFSEYTKTLIPKIDNEIESFYNKKESEASYKFIGDLYPLIKEYCLRDGKRIRPLLVVLAFDGYSLLKRKRDQVIRLSSFLEIMHSLFLVQDDIIDKSDLRRGKKAFHIVCKEKFSKINKNATIGEDISSVVADIMFTNSIEFIRTSGFSHRIKDEILKLFSHTYEMTAWGQILDCLYSNPTKIPIKENIPITVSTLKTAYYTFFYPLMLGYIVSGKRDEAEKKKLEDFALSLGLAFQIRDDILGTFGSKKDIGKPDDSDIHEGKLTLLVQYTLEALNKADEKKFTDRLTKKKKSISDVKYIRNAIEKSGAYDLTLKKHENYIADSLKYLEDLSMKNREKEILHGLIDKIALIE